MIWLKNCWIGIKQLSLTHSLCFTEILTIGKEKYIGIGVTAGASKMGHNTGRDHRKADFIKYYINRGGYVIVILYSYVG